MVGNSIEKVVQLYSKLCDIMSREVFEARLTADICPTVSNITKLVNLNCHMGSEDAERMEEMKDKFYSLAAKMEANASFIIYGTGMTGRQVAEGLFTENIPFYGFCCRNAERFSDGMMGKPVISPEKVFANPEKYYVIIAALAAREILQIMREHHFPEDHIIMFIDSCVDPLQYFPFPSLYRKGTAFIDGGCCDGATSRQFADWCGGEYSKIIAFEPNSLNYDICQRNGKMWGLRDFELVKAGLSSGKTDQNLVMRSGGSFICDQSVWMRPGELNGQQTEEIHTVRIDDFTKNMPVGFIKMDLEGAECGALEGAVNTIKRDRPFLAICVYHRRGDMLTIMDYLLSIVPEYHFWLRHHSSTTCETILYASVD